MARENWNTFLIYLPNISVENRYISKWLAYEEEIKGYAVKDVREKGILERCQAVHQ